MMHDPHLGQIAAKTGQRCLGQRACLPRSTRMWRPMPTQFARHVLQLPFPSNPSLEIQPAAKWLPEERASQDGAVVKSA